MARQAGSAQFAGTLEVLAGGPLDARSIVKLKADLTSVGSFPYPYVGMQVYVVSEDKRYTLINMDTTQESSWREDGNGSGGSSQVDVLPDASADEAGKIYQYVGETDTDYTKGYFYECVESATAGVYEWQVVSIVDDSAYLKKDGSVAADYLTIGTRDGNAGTHSFVQGDSNMATNAQAHAEGYNTKAHGSQSHAEGNSTTAASMASHAEGNMTTASGTMSHAEGSQTTASADASHSEGQDTRASGRFAHAEGLSTNARMTASHAEGNGTDASGDYSHAEGIYTTAGQTAQHVSGMFNYNRTDTLFEIGNGTSNSDRSNAFEVYKDGHINVNGDIYQNGVKRDLTNVYRFAGSIAFADLPALAAAVHGNVYNITDDFTTTADFIEGAGNDYPAGTNVAVANIGTESAPDYKFDIFAAPVELSGYQEKMQVATLPAAASTEVGKIYQYIGATTTDYTNGYFYTCIEDPDNAGSYIWAAKNVQEVSGGGSGELADALTVTEAAGGIKVGDSYAAGTTFEKLWRDLLNPTAYPTLTAPSATLTVSGNRILETGATDTRDFTIAFSRGSISPAYGTSGFRSGEATGYSLNGGTSQATGTFTETVSASNASFQGAVSYDAGEQPKNSIGEDYDTALPASSVNTNTIAFEFVDALWANTASIEAVAKLSLVSKSAKQKDFVFPAQTVENPEVFDVPATWSVTAIQVKNDLSGAYEDAASQFTVTQVTHNDAAGDSVDYNRYSFNLGYSTGSRSIRIKWN